MKRCSTNHEAIDGNCSTGTSRQVFESREDTAEAIDYTLNSETLTIYLDDM